jgi:hypothetical protein
MIELVFGLGKVGVHAKMDLDSARVCLGTLNKKLTIGETFNAFDVASEDVVLTFENEEGLDVLMQALRTCKEYGFTRISPEYRMGA